MLPIRYFQHRMPSYKTKQVDENGKAIYQDVCYPVTKEFREELYETIITEYERAKEQRLEEAKEKAVEKKVDEPVVGGDGFVRVGEDGKVR